MPKICAQARYERQGCQSHPHYNLAEAERLLRLFIADYKQSAPKLAIWAETAIPEGFTVFSFEEKLRKRLRTSNVVERINKEILRRTKVATMFPNEASCLRLVTVVVMEISEEWIVSTRCWLSMKKDGFVCQADA